MITCNLCSQTKDKSLFKKDSRLKSGYVSRCKDCTNEIEKERKRLGPKPTAEDYRVRYAKDKERRIAAVRKWQKANPDKANSISANRRARKLQATPDWLSKDDLALIDWTYHCAKVAESKFGESYHVDHIVPLQGKDVCGLHVPWNLQVITAKENLSKSNSHPPIC